MAGEREDAASPRHGCAPVRKIEPITIDFSVLRTQYEERCPLYDRLCGLVVETLRPRLEKNGVNVHAVFHRVKAWASFDAKALRRGYGDAYETIDDIAGVRVVCLYRDDIPAARKVIGECFDVQDAPDTRPEEADRFGYQGQHVTVKLRGDWSGPHYDALKGLKCEVQLRTIAMDAWDAVSHHLDYKSESGIPEELKRDFYALSALFHVADTQFERLREAQEDSQRRAEEAVQPGSALDMPINYDTLAAYLRLAFPDAAPAPPSLVSSGVDTVHSFGYQTIGDIDKRVQRAKGYMEDALGLISPKMGWRGPPNQAGRLAVSLVITEPKYVLQDGFWAACREDLEAFIREHHLQDTIAL